MPGELKGRTNIAAFKERSKGGLLAPYSSFVCSVGGCCSCWHLHRALLGLCFVFFCVFFGCLLLSVSGGIRFQLRFQLRCLLFIGSICVGYRSPTLTLDPTLTPSLTLTLNLTLTLTLSPVYPLFFYTFGIVLLAVFRFWMACVVL